MKVRKGFTLVELLIVIVIIGILAAAMMLSSGSATASAEASNIVTDLRGMKAGALMLYADSMDAYNFGSLGTGQVEYLKRYMDNPAKFTTTAGYRFFIGGTANDNKWWVGYNLDAAKKPKEVKDKVAGRSASIGLYKDYSSYASTNLYTSPGSQVWMVAR